MINASKLLATNQFLYCLNHPVKLVDPTGFTFEDLQAESKFDHDSPKSEWSASGGGNTWGALMRTLEGATKGLNMAMGQRDMSRSEKHHLLSIYREKQFAQYIDQYGLKLNSDINIVYLPGHRGRHTDFYHNLMLDCIRIVYQEANGDKDLFYEGFGIIYKYVNDHPWLPYAK